MGREAHGGGLTGPSQRCPPTWRPQALETLLWRLGGEECRGWGLRHILSRSPLCCQSAWEGPAILRQCLCPCWGLPSAPCQLWECEGRTRWRDPVPAPRWMPGPWPTHAHLHTDTGSQVPPCPSRSPLPGVHALVSFPLLGAAASRESLCHTVTWDPGPSVRGLPAPDLAWRHLYEAGGKSGVLEGPTPWAGAPSAGASHMSQFREGC